MGQGCKVCEAGEDVLAAVNGAVWDSARVRKPDYRAAGVRLMAEHGGCDPKTITSHADHTERAWHIADGLNYPQVDPAKAHGTDFRGVTARFIGIGHAALTALEISLKRGTIEDGDLIKLAQLGLQATTARQKAEQGDVRTQIEVKAIFAAGSGYLRPSDVSEYEGLLKDVTPRSIDDMRADMTAERDALKLLQAGS